MDTETKRMIDVENQEEAKKIFKGYYKQWQELSEEDKKNNKTFRAYYDENGYFFVFFLNNEGIAVEGYYLTKGGKKVQEVKIDDKKVGGCVIGGKLIIPDPKSSLANDARAAWDHMKPDDDQKHAKSKPVVSGGLTPAAGWKEICTIFGVSATDTSAQLAAVKEHIKELTEKDTSIDQLQPIMDALGMKGERRPEDVKFAVDTLMSVVTCYERITGITFGLEGDEYSLDKFVEDVNNGVITDNELSTYKMILNLEPDDTNDNFCAKLVELCKGNIVELKKDADANKSKIARLNYEMAKLQEKREKAEKHIQNLKRTSDYEKAKIQEKKGNAEKHIVNLKQRLKATERAQEKLDEVYGVLGVSELDAAKEAINNLKGAPADALRPIKTSLGLLETASSDEIIAEIGSLFARAGAAVEIVPAGKAILGAVPVTYKKWGRQQDACLVVGPDMRDGAAIYAFYGLTAKQAESITINKFNFKALVDLYGDTKLSDVLSDSDKAKLQGEGVNLNAVKCVPVQRIYNLEDGGAVTRIVPHRKHKNAGPVIRDFWTRFQYKKLTYDKADYRGMDLEDALNEISNTNVSDVNIGTRYTHEGSGIKYRVALRHGATFAAAAALSGIVAFGVANSNMNFVNNKLHDDNATVTATAENEALGKALSELTHNQKYNEREKAIEAGIKQANTYSSSIAILGAEYKNGAWVSKISDDFVKANIYGINSTGFEAYKQQSGLTYEFNGNTKEIDQETVDAYNEANSTEYDPTLVYTDDTAYGLWSQTGALVAQACINSGETLGTYDSATNVLTLNYKYVGGTRDSMVEQISATTDKTSGIAISKQGAEDAVYAYETAFKECVEEESKTNSNAIVNQETSLASDEVKEAAAALAKKVITDDKSELDVNVVTMEDNYVYIKVTSEETNKLLKVAIDAAGIGADEIAAAINNAKVSDVEVYEQASTIFKQAESYKGKSDSAFAAYEDMYIKGNKESVTDGTLLSETYYASIITIGAGTIEESTGKFVTRTSDSAKHEDGMSNTVAAILSVLDSPALGKDDLDRYSVESAEETEVKTSTQSEKTK